MSGCPGEFLSLPAKLHAVLPADHIAPLRGKARLIVLTGEPDLCKRSFLQRERETGRNYSASVWEANNRPLYAVMDQEWMSPYLLSVFDDSGGWKKVQDLVGAVMAAE